MGVPSKVAVVQLGLFVLGIGLGVVVTGNGLPWWIAPVLSMAVYAGSVEFLLAGLLAAATPLAAIAATTFLVNSRHLFYGLTFPLDRIRSRVGKAYGVYALTDEAYALVSTAPSATMTGKMILRTQVGLHVAWVAGSLVGGLAGGAFLRDVPGVDFVLTALFVVLAMDAHPDRTTLALALAACAVALAAAPGAMLLVAMGGFAGLLVVRHVLARRNAKEAAHA
ncbi:AzlC family ABC transporter permease [Tsukamurella ocularis]|uniref:AzlC family ABC transporter permease n=1 Tax=Tsukamurella ocularis TaxID=1970234 RepID=UPI002168D589|nr:AzlC family ABC transporter permease [Tsukamurella ocularis]MCS3780910.1 4-azaleucine resistance transporter AzlC [Tsukamurella ocularis]MCS3786734.1 4-azaleucine resistance transporter AzlC [Tsukamurella ocularis]MCS3850576.1 4-azaleucine resistance transporter AzlC [Tsukamurella ocularis]